MRVPKSSAWGWMLLPLLLGFTILVTGLTRVSLWSDEGWTIAASQADNPAAVVTDWVIPDVHPPLYFVALNGWQALVGETVFELRYFSLLVTLLGIALAYQLGATAFSHKAGIIGATFYALHDFVAVMTQEVRHYPGQMTLVLLVLWLYWRFLQSPARGRGVAFVLAGVAALYTHYWTALILLACGAHLLLTRWKDRAAFKRILTAFFLIALLYLPWIPALIHQVTLERPNGLPHALPNSKVVYETLLFQLIGTPEVFWLALMTVGAFGAIFWRGASKRDMPGLWLLLAVIVPPMLSILVNTAYPILSFRALAVIVPPAMVLAGVGLARFRPPEWGVVFAFALIYALTSTAASPIERPDWPAIADFIAAHSDSTDRLLLENDTDEYTLTYYLHQIDGEIPYVYSEHVRKYTPDQYAATMTEALDGVNGLWISKLGWPGLPGGDIRPELEAAGFVVSAPEWDYGMYNDRPILLWRMDRPPTDAPLVTFGDNLRLLRAETRFHDGTLTVNLLWSPMTTPTQEVTVSILLFGAESITNADSRPMNGESLTSTWTADGLYFDSHALDLSAYPPGGYAIGVQTYVFTTTDYSQTQNLPTDTCADDSGCRYVLIGEITVR